MRQPSAARTYDTSRSSGLLEEHADLRLDGLGDPEWATPAHEPDRRGDLDVRRPRDVRQRHRRREHRNLAFDGGCQHVRIAASDPARVERAAEPDDEELTIAQRPGDLVRSRE